MILNYDLLNAFSAYQRVRGLSEKTVARRATSLNSITRWIAPAQLITVTPDALEEWLGTFTSAATRRAYRADVMALFNWATRRDLCTANPVARTDSIRVPSTLPRPVPADHLPAILAAAPSELRLMILLAAYAGLRCAEIAMLEAGDVDYNGEAATLMVRHGKGGKDRSVPLHPELAMALRATGVRAGRYFDVTPATVGRRITRHLHALGLTATAHKLRASFATELARTSRGNIVLVATLLGHTNLSTAQRYVGWLGGPAAKAVESMYSSGRRSRGGPAPPSMAA